MSEQEAKYKTKPRPEGLALLREPFPASQISKLPKPTKAQTDEVRADFKKGVRCEICGAWHHPKVVHLDYVGHAALTARLLDCDPSWNWSPLALDEKGLPVVDKDGGMWISLTVCGVTRLGYGDSQDKTGPNAVKERIGDALRNAAMRFGAALDLWSKADLHAEPGEAKEQAVTEPPPPAPDYDAMAGKSVTAGWIGEMEGASANCSIALFRGWWPKMKDAVTADCGEDGAAEVFAAWKKKGVELAEQARSK